MDLEYGYFIKMERAYAHTMRKPGTIAWKLPIEVPTNAAYEEVLKSAVKKHLDHDRNLPRTEHLLLYGSGSSAKYIPGKLY